jgi:hypothetical protein
MVNAIAGRLNQKDEARRMALNFARLLVFSSLYARARTITIGLIGS